MYRFVYWLKIKAPPRNYQPVILVTGCSSGIGLAIAEILVQNQGYRVALSTRSKSIEILKNQFQESDRVWIVPLDVTIETERVDLIQKIEDRWGGVDILVNNAGISFRSTVEDMDEESEHYQMETNYHGPMSLIRLCLKGMRKKGRGKIINISSVSGMLAMPTMASYSASKHALEGASVALWYETRPFGIDVSLIAPGFVRSDSYMKVLYSKKSLVSREGPSPYNKVYTSMEPFIEWLMNRALSTPNSIAKLVLNVIQTQSPPLWVPASFDAEFFYYLNRFLPRRLLNPFLYIMLPNVKTWGINFTQKRKKRIWIFRYIRSQWQRLQR